MVTDEQALRDFEACAIPVEQWTHEWHLRIACAYLHRYPPPDGLPQALARMREGIRRINAHFRIPERIDSGYHETITVAWMTLVAATMERDGRGDDAASFLADHPELLDKRVLLRFYARETIMSWDAKRAFVEPDLGPIEPLGR